MSFISVLWVVARSCHTPAGVSAAGELPLTQLHSSIVRRFCSGLAGQAKVCLFWHCRIWIGHPLCSLASWSFLWSITLFLDVLHIRAQLCLLDQASTYHLAMVVFKSFHHLRRSQTRAGLRANRRESSVIVLWIWSPMPLDRFVWHWRLDYCIGCKDGVNDYLQCGAGWSCFNRIRTTTQNLHIHWRLQILGLPLDGRHIWQAHLPEFTVLS